MGKKSIMLVVLILLIIGGAVLLWQNTHWKTYRSEKYKYAISYPPNLTVRIISGTVKIVEEEDAAFPAINIFGGIRQDINKTIEEFKQKYPQVIVSDTAIGGKAAKKVKIATESSVVVRIVYLVDGFEFNSMPSVHGRFIENGLVDQILSTFRFLE